MAKVGPRGAHSLALQGLCPGRLGSSLQHCPRCPWKSSRVQPSSAARLSCSCLLGPSMARANYGREDFRWGTKMSDEEWDSDTNPNAGLLEEITFLERQSHYDLGKTPSQAETTGPRGGCHQAKCLAFSISPAASSGLAPGPLMVNTLSPLSLSLIWFLSFLSRALPGEAQA